MTYLNGRNLKRVSERCYLQRCGQSQETTKDDGEGESEVRKSGGQLPPIKEQGEGVISGPRDREVLWGGLPDEQRPSCERLNPTGVLEERESVNVAHRDQLLGVGVEKEGIGSKGSNGDYPAQDIFVPLGLWVTWT